MLPPREPAKRRRRPISLDTFGGLVRGLRKQQGLAQSELSDILGLSRSYMCDIEHGRRPPALHRVHAFSEVLKVPKADLFRLVLRFGNERVVLPINPDDDLQTDAISLLLAVWDDLQDEGWAHLAAVLRRLQKDLEPDPGPHHEQPQEPPR